MHKNAVVERFLVYSDKIIFLYDKRMKNHESKGGSHVLFQFERCEAQKPLKCRVVIKKYIYTLSKNFLSSFSEAFYFFTTGSQNSP